MRQQPRRASSGSRSSGRTSNSSAGQLRYRWERCRRRLAFLSFTQVQRRCRLFIAAWIRRAVRSIRTLRDPPPHPEQPTALPAPSLPRYRRADYWATPRSAAPTDSSSSSLLTSNTGRPTNAQPLSLSLSGSLSLHLLSLAASQPQPRPTSTIHHQNWQLIEAYQASGGCCCCCCRRRSVSWF